MGRADNSIFARNKDVEHLVNAAAGMGVYGLGKTMPKRFSLLVSTDMHRCQQQILNTIDYLNGMDALDAGICLGDIQGGNYTENDGSWYYMAVNRTKKPFYTLIGNHDGGNSAKKELAGTKAEVLEKFIRTTRGAMRMPNIDKTYYAVNFDEYKVTLIALDNYMAPEDRDEDGNFVISRGVECMDQEQVDWLIETLKAVPPEYHVVIARHGYPDNSEKIECDWTQVRGGIDTEASPYGKSDLVPDIVDAWVHGSAISKTYAPMESWEGLPTLKAEADFSERGEGAFITYLIGHVHRDIIGRSTTYPYQNIICFPSSCNDDWTNYGCDLPRLRDTKAEECLTTVSVDTEGRRIHLVRIGSNITLDMVERTHWTLTY